MAGAMKRYRRRITALMDRGEVIICALCNEPIDPTEPSYRAGYGVKGGFTVDHIQPRSLGGKTAVSNFQPTHVRCNQDKGNGLKK